MKKKYKQISKYINKYFHKFGEMKLKIREKNGTSTCS